jgi:hypothetical protein
MKQRVYNWKRFWYPRGKALNLSDSNGYLADPETPWGRAVNPELAELEEMSEIPCLILLGEPRMGKSTTLERLKKRLDTKSKNSNDELFWQDLQAFGTEDSLWREIFEDPKFK